jgi:hypothetical protein
LGQRSRKRRRAAQARPAAGGGQPRARARAEERNARAREALAPLGAGERPQAVTVAAIVAALLAIANLVMFLAGYRVRGASNQTGGLVVFEVLLVVAAIGMWRARYWAVMGFETLLGITILYASLSLVVASNWWGVLLCLAIVVPAGFLFWKLIRAMARLQMPQRRPT